MPEPHARRRRLGWIFAGGFALSLFGALVLLNPTLEFLAFDLAERLRLPLRIVGPVVTYSEWGLFLISGAGLLFVAVRSLTRRWRSRSR